MTRPAGRRTLAGGVAVVVALALMVISPAGALGGTTTGVAAAGPPAPSYVGLAPARLLDTRPGTTTVDGQAQRTGPLAPGETRVLQVGGRGGVPANATAAVLNITATAPTAPGFLTVFPTGAPRPQASNLNFVAGQTIANLALATLGTNGQISIYNNSGSTQVIGDTSGAFPAGSSYSPQTPARLLDTRPGTTTVDGQAQRTGPLAPGETRVLQIGGRAGVPANATAAVLNITATAPTAPGFLTVFPTGAPRPQASNLNFVAGQTIANLALATLGTNGQVSIYNNSGSTQVIGDVSGSFPGSAGTTAGFHVGVYGSPDPQYVDAALVSRIAALNTKIMRVELPAVPSEKSALQTTIDLACARGVTVQPLLGWANGTAAPDMTFLADWARTFGPGGTHWAGRANPCPVVNFELGNENSYYYKSGLPTDAHFQSLATSYGQRAVAAARAVGAANAGAGVLVELDTDSTNLAWIDKTLAAGGPDLIRLMHGPAAHIYGPGYRTRLNTLSAAMQSRGVARPYFITEWGIATDNGNTLSDNYGYPTAMTYDQAGAELKNVLDYFATQPTRIQQLLIYTNMDSAGHGETNNREKYFGIYRARTLDKGTFTSNARAEMTAHP